MVKSDGIAVPAGGERPLLVLLRESGDVLEASAPAFDAAAGAARLREAAQARGLLQPEGLAGKESAVSGAFMDEEVPAFDVEAGAVRLRQAALARGLLSGSAPQVSGHTASWTGRRDRKIIRHSREAPASRPHVLHGRYRLLYQLGAGGMGSVWLAEDLQLERTVALKELVQHGAGADLAERRSRALQEARAIARVRHPATVSIHDILFAGDDPWIVMEYISGRSLDAILSEQPQLDEPVIAAIGMQVARGLSAAHEAGVVHRDVKPANILVTADASVRLVDFGIAQVAEDPSFTDRQTVVGTLDFLAPERLRGDTAQPAADLWALGVTLFYALEGYLPFRRETGSATMRAIMENDPARPARQGRLGDVILGLLAKDPASRAKADELADILQVIATGATLPDPESKALPQPATARRSRLAEVTLAGLSFDEAREVIGKLRPDTAVAMLTAMPEDEAGRILASYPADACREFFQSIAVARPDKARNILQALRTADASQILAYLEPRTAAAVMDTMSPSEAARIISRTEPMTAARIITELRVKVSASLITAMEARQVAEILSHMDPAAVTSVLVATSSTVSAAVLRRLNPVLRAHVAQSLPHEDRTLS